MAGTQVLGSHRLVRLAGTGDVTVGAPGRFHMVRDPDGPELLPWAVALVADGAGSASVLVGSAGPTRHLAEARRLSVLGPLGRGFQVAGLDAATTLVVAQGHGVATVAGLEGVLGAAPRVLVVASGEDAGPARALLGSGVEAASPEGVTGRVEALVTDGAVRHVLVAAAPGPAASVVALCRRLDVPCQVALEAPMACGFGACFGCVVRLDGTWRRLCLEGPVVDARRLDA